MNEIFSNSTYKYVSFPEEEFLSKFNKFPEKFDPNFVLEYLIGGFSALLLSSELQQDVEIIPDWKDPSVIFIYKLSDFEIEYLKTLPEEDLLKILKERSYSGELDFTKDSRKKRIKGSLNIDFSVSEFTKINDIQISFDIKLELEKAYDPQPQLFSSFLERNEYLIKEIDYLKTQFCECLNFNTSKSQTKRTINYVPDYLSFATAPVFQDLRRFATISQGKKLELQNYSFELTEDFSTELYTQISNMSDLTVDVLNGIIHLWLTNKKNNSDPILISTDDLLFIRNIKAKLNNLKNRGGYNEKTRKSVVEQIELLSNINIKANNLFPHIKNQTISGESKVLNISKWTKQDNLGNKQFYFLVKPGDILNMTLSGSRTQLGILHRKIAEYNHCKYFWEKRLGNYLAWIWRTRQSKGDFIAPLKVKSLIKEVKTDFDVSRPNLIKERLEQAFDRLLEDGIIKSWQYEFIDEDMFSKKKWLDTWLELKILVEPPIDIIEKYSKIKKNDFPSILIDEDLGKLKKIMEKRAISQSKIAEEMNITPAQFAKIISKKSLFDEETAKKIKKYIEFNL